MRTTWHLKMMTLVCVLYGCGQTPDPLSSTQPVVNGGPMEKWARSCALCHISGIGGAPRVGDAEDWSPRLKQGDDLLLSHAVAGYNNMPPLGYCMDCQRADFMTLIKFMSTGTQP